MNDGLAATIERIMAEARAKGEREEFVPEYFDCSFCRDSGLVAMTAGRFDVGNKDRSRGDLPRVVMVEASLERPVFKRCGRCVVERAPKPKAGDYGADAA